MNFEAVIGLEIHVELKTRAKMFSWAPNAFSTEHNCNVCVVDMAFPGTMPTVNKQVVIDAIRVCNALHMTIDDTLTFERKNYFYSDLPKGYQITQQFHPIGRDGYLILDMDGQKVKIEIERLHMEEDTCKQLHLSDHTLLDYNRAGVPLVEIVSRPQIKNGTEAMKYVETIRNIVTYAGVSDGKMEEGSLRCDVNVSIRPCGAEYLGTKVEIKNLNSIANVQRAIDFEMDRQARLLLKGLPVRQETRRFDEMKKETVLMRVKTDAVDYKYFTEPNIVPIKLSKQFIEDAINSCPELLEQKKERYITNFNLTPYDADVLLSNKKVAQYFENVCAFTKEYKLAANWINVDVNAYLNKNNLSIDEFEIVPEDLAYLINNVASGKINSKMARDLFQKSLNENISLKKLCDSQPNDTINDENQIREMAKEVIKNNPQIVADFKAGKDRALGFVVGQIMKASKGKANPVVASSICKEELSK
jgi:aspartyl-tRNA(Asn)/glutamyl-tRNA(Gln) amidotransferase subunit B